MEVKDQNLDLFGEVCERYNMRFSREDMCAYDTLWSGRIELHATDHGSYTLFTDSDPRYNSIARRVEGGLDRICRDYSEAVIDRTTSNSGGCITNREEREDGSLYLTVAVGF